MSVGNATAWLLVLVAPLGVAIALSGGLIMLAVAYSLIVVEAGRAKAVRGWLVMGKALLWWPLLDDRSRAALEAPRAALEAIAEQSARGGEPARDGAKTPLDSP